MFPPTWFVPFDALIELVTAAVALMVALFAFQGHHWIRERTLYALFLAFMLLSVGLFLNGLTLSYAFLAGETFVRHTGPVAVADLGIWAYYIMSILAYSILVFAYASRLRGGAVAMAAGGMAGKGAAAGTSLLTAGPFLELVLVALLFVIVVSQLAHMTVKRSRNAYVVSLSFSLLLISHILIMFSSVQDVFYVIGRFFELGGFIALFMMLSDLRRTR